MLGLLGLAADQKEDFRDIWFNIDLVQILHVILNFQICAWRVKW